MADRRPVAGTVLIAPAAAPIGKDVAHLWTAHLLPLADARYVQLGKATFSCPGASFYPWTDTIGHSGLGLRSPRTTGGDFTCEATMPDGPAITSVAFSIKDSSSSVLVSCNFKRVRVVGGVPGTVETLAGGSTTSIAGTPGNVLWTNANVSNPVVDNDTFGYFFDCYMPGNNTLTGVYGATVTYET